MGNMELLHTHECVFCSKRGSETDYQLCDTLLHENDHFIVMPSLGSIVPGWLLVVSRDHFLCSAQLSSYAREVLEASLLAARLLISPKFGAPTLFEHGPAMRNTPVGCGIDHLHIHLAPLPASLMDICVDLYGTVWKKVQSEMDLPLIHRNGMSYMSVKEPSGDWYYADPPEGVRQPLRRAIAAMVGTPEQFDYRLHSFEHNIDLTVRKISLAA